MRLSEFWTLVDEEFGPAYARTLAGDQVLDGLGDRTAAQALDAGVDPRDVWHALCDALDVPPDRRLGRDPDVRAQPRERSHGRPAARQR